MEIKSEIELAPDAQYDESGKMISRQVSEKDETK